MSSLQDLLTSSALSAILVHVLLFIKLMWCVHALPQLPMYCCPFSLMNIVHLYLAS